MPDIPFESPLEETVPKVDEIDVGENLEFQRKWWRFEKIVWPILLAIVVADLLGVFGRGWLAKARRSTPDQALTLEYERVARASTPSTMTFRFSEAAIHHGRIVLFVSQSIVKGLGVRQISPQPEKSTIGADGITYEFPATTVPASVQIELEPSFPGSQRFWVQVEGSPPIRASVFVVP